VPVTVAVNGVVSFVPRVTEDGLIVTLIPELTVTVALAVADESAWEIAVMVTLAGLGTAPGAV
jgi:hypothetical protein